MVMERLEWVDRFKDAMRLPDPVATSRALLDLAQVADQSSKTAITEWHAQQALGTAGTVLEEAGKHEEALPLYLRTLELSRSWATYWTKAATHLWAVIALLHFSQGRVEEGRSAAHEALRFLGREPESDATLVRLLQELAKHDRLTDPRSRG
jgi:hypothetical protein